jgi:hypothetical protein
MPSLQEIIEGDLGLGAEESVKTASEHESDKSDNQEIEKLAMELGLADDSNESDSNHLTTNNVSGHSKEASVSSLDNIYSDMFPGDADVINGFTEKNASENEGLEKEAADREERIGRAAFENFSIFVDAHLDKIAEELSGSATVDMNKDPEEEPSQTMASNKPANSDEAIDTAPQVEDQVTAKNDEKTVGHFEQRDSMAGDGEQKSETKQAAVRKHLLLLAMGQA